MIGRLEFGKDKPGKDTNFRGLTIFDNTVYISKGSGGNGINTVYQVGGQGTLPTWHSCTASQPYRLRFCPVSQTQPPAPRRRFPSGFGSPTPTRSTFAMKATEPT